MTIIELLVALATGFVAGAYAGLLGVGGGIVIVPSLVILLSVPQQAAQGTSLLVIVATATVGSLANARRGLLETRLAILLGAGGVMGAVAGSILALRVLDELALRRIFGVILLLVGARLLWRPRTRPAQGSIPPSP